MKIIIENNIQMGNERDHVHEEVTGIFKEKSGSNYLIYQNAEEEKVIIKFNETGLNIRRFSQPLTILTCIKNKLSVAQIPLPMGIKRFITKTRQFHYNVKDKSIHCHYQLLYDNETKDIFADYHLVIRWFDIE